MKIIISPAKTMAVDPSHPGTTIPAFKDKAEEILYTLKGKSAEDLKKLWKCSDKIVDENMKRLQTMDLDDPGTAALFAYTGVQYKAINPRTLDEDSIQYLNEHLRILSGFYGILKPTDGIQPYRLDIQKGFWKDSIYKELVKEDHVILDLSSMEYGEAVLKYRTGTERYIIVDFLQMDDGEVVRYSAEVKKARGRMVRFLAENKIEDPSEIKDFHEDGYALMEADLHTDKFTFIKKA